MKKTKKILAIIGILLLTGALLISFLNKNGGDEPENPTPTADATIQDALSSLEEEGYVKTEDGYVLEQSADGVGSVCTISADGNDLELCLKFDYGDGNANMKSYYQEQDEAVYVMVSAYLAKLADISGADATTMHYSIYVGDDKVRDDEMSLQEAQDYQKLAND